jgi:hypothetical protein
MRESKARKKMDYCDSDDVKGPLHIDLAETKFDRLLELGSLQFALVLSQKLLWENI